MKYSLYAILIVLALGPAIGAAPQQDNHAAKAPLPWAYGFETDDPTVQVPVNPPLKDDGTMKHLPDSKLAFTATQISNAFGPADWFPGDHPAMPEVVAAGRKTSVNACALCHYPNGKGRPENAGVSGLPVEYFIQQMADFKNGVRKSAEPRKTNTNRMIAYAMAMTDEEVRISAEYFASMKWTPWIKVIETQQVPKTRTQAGMFLPLEGNQTEPLGQRIIEVPVDVEATERLRNPRSSFIAYVPVGSIKKGEGMVKNGAGKTIACGICHGQDMKGLGPIPGLAGRSPSYMGRQIYDIQHGFRKGPFTPLMQQAVKNLNNDDIVAITAYLASLAP